jgi:hypothetical protein
MKPVGSMLRSTAPGLPVEAPPSPEVEAGPFRIIGRDVSQESLCFRSIFF